MIEFAVHPGEWIRAYDGVAVTVSETGVLMIRGLADGDIVTMYDIVAPGRDSGSERMIHLAPLSIIGEVPVAVLSVDGAQRCELQLTVEPSKLRAGEFEQILLDLEQVWAGLIFSEDSLSRVSTGIIDIASLWSGVRDSVASILEAPYAPLARATGTTPYANARKVDFRPSARLAQGLITKTRLPSVTARPVVDNPANRMVVQLLDRFIRAADLAGVRAVAEHARMLRRHPTLAGLRSEVSASPPRGAVRDQRYARCFRALHEIGDTPVLLGPGQRPIALARMCEIYEYWVYLQVVLAMEQLTGPPLEPGYRPLGRRATRNAVRLELPPGYTVSFPGDVHVTFCPSIPRGPGHPGSFAYISSVGIDSREGSRPTLQWVTPDVVVRGPAGTVILDAKYVGERHIDAAARKIHAQYARLKITNPSAGRIQSVIAVHPHITNDYIDFAGYSALPLAPGYRGEWLPDRLSVVL